MLKAIQSVGIWSVILLCGSIVLVIVKEIVKLVFEGLTTW